MTKPDLTSHGESPPDAEPAPQMAVVDPEDLVGCTFLLDEQDDSQCFVQVPLNGLPSMTRSKQGWALSISSSDAQSTTIHTKRPILYNKLMDFIQKNAINEESLWRFKRIVGHQGHGLL